MCGSWILWVTHLKSVNISTKSEFLGMAPGNYILKILMFPVIFFFISVLKIILENSWYKDLLDTLLYFAWVVRLIFNSFPNICINELLTEYLVFSLKINQHSRAYYF